MLLFGTLTIRTMPRLQEAAKFSMVRLEEILEMLLQIDLDIKTGRVDSLLALDMLIARLCTTG